MSFQLSIPWRVALQQSSPLLPQLGVMLQPITPVRRVIFSERQPGSFCTVSTEGVTPQRMHSRDPSTCAHPAKRDSRGAQGDNSETISPNCTTTRGAAGDLAERPDGVFSPDALLRRLDQIVLPLAATCY